MDEYMDNWVMLLVHDGTVERAHDHWILGKGSKRMEPRWSIIRDVLGWIDQ
jgi:hypothetical protein